MSKYIDNINSYLKENKIKKSYVSLMTGIDASKLSRLLNKTQEIGFSDMDKIANALGKTIEYFMSGDFDEKLKKDRVSTEYAFYVGNPGPEQQAFAVKLIELAETADYILGARSRYMMIGED